MKYSQFNKDITRRQFLNGLGKVGGTVTVFGAMQSLGLLSAPSVNANSFEPPKQSDLSAVQKNGKRIIILGGGLAGMAAAYELSKAGYDCQILEARGRSGGRNWTVRKNTEETDTDGVTQKASFDKDLYFNAGPARIPQHHVTLDYCRELGVPIEPFTNVNEAAYYYNEDVGLLSNKKIRKRAAKADMRGYTSELLAKALDQNALDQPLTSEDKERLTSFLRSEGGLSRDLFYEGSSARGYNTLPGVDEGVMEDPFDFSALLQSGFGNNFSSEYSFNQQMMMFQPVGGMDKIPEAFEKQVKNMITFHTEVQEIRQSEDGVRVVYKDRSSRPKEINGDYCICTIPLPVLKDIPADFSSEMAEAIKSINYASTGKIALQFKRRFWEEDENIYGGMTNTNMDITQIWYPSSDYLSQKGILVGYYNFGENAEKIGDLSIKEREAHAIKQGTKIHPAYPDEFENSFSVAWHKVKYNLGGWASYSQEDRERYYPVLKEPDGRIYIAGEHLSYYTGWMAGAFESAQYVVDKIHQRVIKEEPVTSNAS
ncbi:flavin monoamine oxidase family protein [Alteribacillus sp. YIM 98480]|uniref:flavin monoamine oxidase family protein n=1 Tax=Alteribacillus sp. YIM 98480 TaxID=2606599 RepID=UPI00131D4F36|nr:flavin monoamine oxidase family protein [Alteribacillus sp. YIM 98480]